MCKLNLFDCIIVNSKYILYSECTISKNTLKIPNNFFKNQVIKQNE